MAAAAKSYVGHSLAPASADQLLSALGAFRYGLIPGIKTIERVADDVHQSHLRIENGDIEVGEQGLDVCFLNSKGFGGNNATATILAAHIAADMLAKRYGKAAMLAYQQRQEKTAENTATYDQACLDGPIPAIYRFGQNMIDETEIDIEPTSLKIPGFSNSVDLGFDNPYADMTD